MANPDHDPLWVRARLLPADAAKLRTEDLPALPEWFPLPPKTPEGDPLPPHSTEQRAALRHARAVAEACAGPLDGHRNAVRRESPDGPPLPSLSLYDGTVVYVLDPDLTTTDFATYRYSPQLSHVHQGAMRAVEAGFNEYGQDYAQEASHDDTTAPLYSSRR